MRNQIQIQDRCDKCHKRKGIWTKFFYGSESEIAREHVNDFMNPGTKITSRIKVEGEYIIHLCNSCKIKFLIWKCFWNIIGTVVLGSLTIILISDEQNPKKTLFLIFGMIFALIPFGFFIFHLKNLFSTSDNSREEAAIGIFSKVLKDKGFNKFWTYKDIKNGNLNNW
jgi:hypothetical protein